MKNIYKYMILAAAALSLSAACTKEETLSPSGKDKDSSADLKITSPIAQQIYKNTGVAIISDFDPTNDVLYLGADYGVDKTTTITLLENQEDAAVAIEWLNRKVLAAFDDKAMKNLFPKRVFLAGNVVSSMGYATTLGGWYIHVRWTNNLWGISGAQHALSYPQGLLVNVNPTYLRAEKPEADYDMQFGEDILSIAIISILMDNDLIAPCLKNDMLMVDSKTEAMYGKRLLNSYNKSTALPGSSQKWTSLTALGIGTTFDGYSPSDPVRGDLEVCAKDSTKIDMKYYFRYGFVEEPDRDGVYGSWYGFPKADGTMYEYSSVNYKGYTAALGPQKIKVESIITSIGSIIAPVDIYEDVRNMVQAMVHLSKSRWDSYGPRIQQRLTALHQYLRSLGIDIGKVNEAVDTLIPKE